jgi:rhomboid protease GluP
VLRRLGGDDLGFVKITIGACTVLYLISLLLTVRWQPEALMGGGFLNILGVGWQSEFLLGAAGLAPVWGLEPVPGAHHWWSLLSAGWLHGSLLHIFFNMYWVRILAPPVAKLYGAGRMVIIYTVASVVGFFFSSCALVLLGFVLPTGLVSLLGHVMGVARLTVGASAALMGLLGAMVHYGRRGGSPEIGRWAWGYVILFFVFGLFFRGIDNWAHLGGFLGGWLTARVLDPLKPERLDHLAAAVVCLAAALLAVIASVLTGLPLISR